jgi:hypothetical protein
MARGSAASLEVVLKAMAAGSLTTWMNLRIGTRKRNAIGTNTAKINTASAR